MVVHISEKLRKAMHSLGLTEYEIRAYVALLQHGELTASQVSEVADISYSKIYEVLDSLMRKGWIMSKEGRPARYYPRSPIAALDINRVRIERELKSCENAVISELMPLYEGKGSKEKHDVWILRGEESILMKAKDLILGCENELKIAAPWMSRELLEIFLPSLAIVASRGGKIQLMLSSKCKRSIVKRLSEISEIRFRDQMFGGGIIADSKETIIILSSEETGSPSLAIWSDHISLAKVAGIYFDHLWKEAEPFKG